MEKDLTDAERTMLLKRGDIRMITMKTVDGEKHEALLTVTRIDRKNKKAWMKNKELGHAIKFQLK